MTVNAEMRLHRLASTLPREIAYAFETGNSEPLRAIVAQISEIIDKVSEQPASEGLAMIKDARKQLKKLAGV